MLPACSSFSRATLAGCAPRLTLAQEMTWQAYEACVKDVGGADVRLERVLDNGNWYLLGYEHLYTVNNCMKQYWQDARVRAQLPREATPAAPLEDPLRPPHWNTGDEWAFSSQSPTGTGTFIWSVDREDRVDGTDYYVLRYGQQGEAFFRKSDLPILHSFAMPGHWVSGASGSRP